LILHPRNTDVKATKEFVKSVFKDVPVEIEKTPEKRVEQIVIEGAHARAAVDCLFWKRSINGDDYARIDNSLLALDQCLEYQAKISVEATPAQQELIESIVDLYVNDLTWRFKPEKLAPLLTLASRTIRKVRGSQSAFNREMTPHLRKNVAAETKTQVLGALCALGRILAGTANLEDPLLQKGATLPNLKAQKRIVFQKLDLI